MKKSVLLTLFMIISGTTALAPVYAQDDLVYVAVEPCRLADTRKTGVMVDGVSRNFQVYGTNLTAQGGDQTGCAHPKDGAGAEPLAASVYIVAVPAGSSGGGWLTAFPSDQPTPAKQSVATVNYAKGQVIGNTTIVTLCQSGSCPTDGQLGLVSFNSEQDVVLDVQGYFYPMEGGSIYVKSNGENIGLSVDTSYDSSLGIEPWTYTVFNNKGYMFEVTLEGVIEIAANLRFESSNCTGQAYFRVGNTTGPVGTGTVFRRRDTLEASYILKGTQPVLIQEGSFMTSQGDCTITFNEWHMVPILPNDPTVTGVQNSYATPITLGF